MHFTDPHADPVKSHEFHRAHIWGCHISIKLIKFDKKTAQALV